MTELEIVQGILADPNAQRVFEEDNHAPDHIVCGSNGIVGSKQVKCICGAILYISPKGQAMKAKYPAAPIICVMCARRMLDAANAPAK